MKPSTLLYVALSTFGSASASTNSTLDALTEESSANIMAILKARTASGASGCTSENVVVRQEWSALSADNKTDYIEAVKCMMELAPITPLSAAPGVRSRFDDFAALHINMTTTVHWTSVFYTWHRYYTWTWEQAMRDECGYTGYQPYWDWSLTTTLSAHPLFDGSNTSISGNGEAIDHVSYVLIPTPIVVNATIASGSGGGCLTDGPFKNLTVNLGPYGAPVTDGLEYNPRCLTRDFRDSFLTSYLTYDNVTTAMLATDMAAYEAIVEASTGLHSNGHTAGGGFQTDLWGSAQDPSFQFHHAQIDRVWALWQGLNQTVRTQEVSGTLTIKDLPPSANGTLDTVVDLGYLADKSTIRTLSSTIDGPFCYIYA